MTWSADGNMHFASTQFAAKCINACHDDVKVLPSFVSLKAASIVDHVRASNVDENGTRQQHVTFMVSNAHVQCVRKCAW